MSKPDFGSISPLGDAFSAFLDGVAKFVMWIGLAATLIALGFLIYTYSMFAGSGAGVGTAGVTVDQALSNVDMFQKILLAGVIAAGVGSTYLFWGEDILGPAQLGFAAILFFSPLYLPSILGSGHGIGNVESNVLGTLQMSGTVFGILALGVTLADIFQRVQVRAQHGSRADQLKYGKGLREEQDIQNVFMGRCWQLPFCRKFVRERCPIYHSKRTCWKERVGCMCEEQVIRDAMAGKTIPKDAVAAAQFIPYNLKLTMPQKEERCRQCVIYNEHQKHKYKVALPVAFFVFVGVYALLRTPLLDAMTTMLESLDRVIGRASLRGDVNIGGNIASSGLPLQEMLLLCFVVVAFTYALKLIEFLIFKLKI